MNAAVWFGASLFFIVGLTPTFFPAVEKHLGEVWTGIITFMAFERYFALQYWCGAIALAHHVAEWVYLGRPLQRIMLAIVLGVFGIGLLGGLWLQPRMERLHSVKYAKADTYSQQQRVAASKSLRAWQGISRAIGVISLAALGVYMWRMGNPPNPPRFMPSSKFRS